MKRPDIDFTAQEFDEFLQDWLHHGLTSGELREWREILMADARFRAQFCEWLKSLRDHGWAGLRSHNRLPA